MCRDTHIDRSPLTGPLPARLAARCVIQHWIMDIPLDVSARPIPTDLHTGALNSQQPKTLRVVAWTDPEVDALGIDPRSHYVETFWLGVLGPSATWLLRRLADRLETEPEGFDLDLDEMARSLGLGPPDRRDSPLCRAIDRCLRYGMARRCGGVLAVRRHVPPVPRRQLIRLPTALQESHRTWEPTRHEPDEGVRLRRRARLVALDLRDLGVDDACIERHLLRRGVHPATAFEAARWAWSPAGEEDRPYVAGSV